MSGQGQRDLDRAWARGFEAGCDLDRMVRWAFTAGSAAVALAMLGLLALMMITGR